MRPEARPELIPPAQEQPCNGAEKEAQDDDTCDQRDGEEELLPVFRVNTDQPDSEDLHAIVPGNRHAKGERRWGVIRRVGSGVVRGAWRTQEKEGGTFSLV